MWGEVGGTHFLIIRRGCRGRGELGDKLPDHVRGKKGGGGGGGGGGGELGETLPDHVRGRCGVEGWSNRREGRIL